MRDMHAEKNNADRRRRAFIIMLWSSLCCAAALYGEPISACTDLPARISGANPTCYSTLQAAYDAASDGAVIQCKNTVFFENLTANRNITVTLQGGYDSAYSTVTGVTYINGSISTTAGSVTGGNFMVRSGPIVDIASPMSGGTNDVTPSLLYSVSDGTVTVTVDGTTVSKVSGDSLAALSDGAHTVRVTAMDAGGNTGFDQVSFTVDTTAPLVSITSPQGPVVNTATPTLTYTASEGAVDILVDGGLVAVASGNALSAFSDGPHTVRVEARDIGGNTGYDEESFLVDTAQPVITAFAINGGAENAHSAQVSLTIAATDANGVGQMQFSNDGVTWSDYYAYAEVKTWSLSSGNGQKTVYARVRDAAGKESAISSSTITYTYDAQVPANFKAVATSANSITLSWSAVPGFNNYWIEYRAGQSGSFSSLGWGYASSSSYTHSGRAADTTYYYRIRTQLTTATYSEYAEAIAAIRSVSNVAATSHEIDTSSSNASIPNYATIFYPTSASTGTATLKIVLESEGPEATPVYSASQSCPSPGCSFTWTGKNQSGSTVSDDAYLYIIEATDGTNFTFYNPAAPPAGTIISCSQGTSFDPYRNEPLAISYTLQAPARVKLSATDTADRRTTLLDNSPHLEGSYTYEWNGITDQNTYVTSATSTCSAEPLRENVILTNGDSPIISEVTIDPYQISLSYGQFVRISYKLTTMDPANVSISLTSPSNALYTIQNEQQVSGEYIVTWPDLVTYTGSQFSVTQEGQYTVTIKAWTSSERIHSVSRTVKVEY